MLPSQIKNIEKVLQNVEFSDNGIPYLSDKGMQNFFTHMQRKVKKIQGENYIVDCFKNEDDQVLIKAKSFNSQKEYSLKVNRKPSANAIEDINEKILPKLRIREESLMLSQSINMAPKLIYYEERLMNGILYDISIYDKFTEVIIGAKGNNGTFYEIAVDKNQRNITGEINEVIARDLSKLIIIQDNKIILMQKQDLHENAPGSVEIKENDNNIKDEKKKLINKENEKINENEKISENEKNTREENEMINENENETINENQKSNEEENKVIKDDENANDHFLSPSKFSLSLSLSRLTFTCQGATTKNIHLTFCGLFLSL